MYGYDEHTDPTQEALEDIRMELALAREQSAKRIKWSCFGALSPSPTSPAGSPPVAFRLPSGLQPRPLYYS